MKIIIFFYYFKSKITLLLCLKYFEGYFTKASFYISQVVMFVIIGNGRENICRKTKLIFPIKFSPSVITEKKIWTPPPTNCDI